MKLKFIVIYIIVIIFLPCSAAGQDILIDEEKLVDLFGKIRDETDDSAKVRYNKEIVSIVERFVHSDLVWEHNFTSVRNLGQIVSPDSLLKIINWNLNTGKGKGKYYCYFIKKENGKNTVYRLIRSYSEAIILRDTTYCPGNWYGALYYDARPCEAEGKTYYILLGLDYGNPYVSRKIIDVLGFDDICSPRFGRKWFARSAGMEYRQVFEYSSEATMTLRFTSDTSIVFDHLVPVSSDADRLYYAPDYSYDAFIYNSGKWKFMLNIDARNRE